MAALVRRTCSARSLECGRRILAAKFHSSTPVEDKRNVQLEESIAILKAVHGKNGVGPSSLVNAIFALSHSLAKESAVDPAQALREATLDIDVSSRMDLIEGMLQGLKLAVDQDAEHGRYRDAQISNAQDDLQKKFQNLEDDVRGGLKGALSRSEHQNFEHHMRDCLQGALCKFEDIGEELKSRFGDIKEDIRDLKGAVSSVDDIRKDVGDLTGAVSTLEDIAEDLTGAVSTLEDIAEDLTGAVSNLNDSIDNLDTDDDSDSEDELNTRVKTGFNDLDTTFKTGLDHLDTSLRTGIALVLETTKDDKEEVKQLISSLEASLLEERTYEAIKDVRFDFEALVRKAVATQAEEMRRRSQ